MRLLPLRLTPGQDLRRALEAILAEQEASAAFVLQGIGSLSTVQLRLAGASQLTQLRGDFEILTLAGSLSLDGAHLHGSIADADGHVIGGHLATGCIIRTTAEILVALMPGHRLTRMLDQATGSNELVIFPCDDVMDRRCDRMPDGPE